MLSRYARGAATGNRLYSHEGEECPLVLERTMKLQLRHETYILKEGDSIRFEYAVPRHATNIGRRPLRAT
jgi:uncharacterized cupin superfamily protein